MSAPGPIYLFADSHLLFWKRTDGSLFLSEILDGLRVRRPSVAYIGASNLDNLDIYDSVFMSAMQQVHIGECRMIRKHSDLDGANFLENADVLLLAGGDVETGWRAFEDNGLKDIIPRRFREGAMLIGISAGAVQLGRGSFSSNGSALLSTFGLLPFYVGAHEERDGWSILRKVAGLAGQQSRALGIPFGAGVRYHSGEIEVFYKPVLEMAVEESGIREKLIYPRVEN